MSKVIKVSEALSTHLESIREGNESYDNLLRRYFGITLRDGRKQKRILKHKKLPRSLYTYFVIHNSGEPLIFLTKAEAKGAAIVRAVRNEKRKAEAVLTVRETNR